LTNSIYVCAASLCCSLVACAVIRIILPSGNTERIMTVILSVFVLCCLFKPIIDIVKNINLSLNEDHFNVTEESITVLQDERVIEETAKYLNEYVNEILVSKGVENASIKTILSTNENRGIYIKELNIYLDKDNMDKSKDVKEWILSLVGIEPVISEC